MDYDIVNFILTILEKLNNWLNMIFHQVIETMFLIMCDLTSFIFTTLENLDDLPNIIQAISIALLTILIPLAIAILTEIYQKRKDQKIEFVDLDLHVILDSVFRIMRLEFKWPDPLSTAPQLTQTSEWLIHGQFN